MFKSNLQSILNSFNTTITRLDELTARNKATAQQNEVKISVLTADNVALTNEAEQATVVAQRLRALLA